MGGEKTSLRRLSDLLRHFFLTIGRATLHGMSLWSFADTGSALIFLSWSDDIVRDSLVVSFVSIICIRELINLNVWTSIFLLFGCGSLPFRLRFWVALYVWSTLICVILLPSSILVVLLLSLRWWVEGLWGLLSDLEHLFHEIFKDVVLILDFKLLNLLESFHLNIVRVILRGVFKSLLFILKLHNLFSLIDHDFSLSFDNVSLPSKLPLKSFILSLQSLSDDLQRWTAGALSILLWAHGGSFLEINTLSWLDLFLLVEQTLRLIRLIQHFLKSAVLCCSILLPPILYLNSISFPLKLHELLSILGFLRELLPLRRRLLWQLLSVRSDHWRRVHKVTRSLPLTRWVSFIESLTIFRFLNLWRAWGFLLNLLLSKLLQAYRCIQLDDLLLLSIK